MDPTLPYGVTEAVQNVQTHVHHFTNTHKLQVPHMAIHHVTPHITQGVSHMSYLTIAGWAALGLAGYGVGRIGLAKTWADLQGIYSWIRSKFSGSQTQAPAPVAAPAPQAAA